MLPRLIFLFTVIPLIELTLLIKLGQYMGIANTIALVLITGMLGAYFARQQGFFVFARIQQDMARGQMPTDSLLDALMVFAGALLLITPGLLTDIVGLSLLVPVSRAIIRKRVRRYIQQRIQIRSNYSHLNPDDQVN